MSHVMKISEAASLGLHTMVMLAGNQEKLLSAKVISGKLKVSEAHLAKVLQRLAHGGLVKSIRGPKGGFKLAKAKEKISLLEVFEAIEGPMIFNPCLLGGSVCSGKKCIFGEVLGLGNQMFRQYMMGTNLEMLSSTFKEECHVS